MTGSGKDFRLGIVARKVLIDFVGVCQIRRSWAIWVWETKSKLQGVLWGKVGIGFSTLALYAVIFLRLVRSSEGHMTIMDPSWTAENMKW